MPLFSPAEIDSATALLVSKTADAIRECGGDFERANALLWRWCQSDEALRDAVLRIVFAQNVVRLTISGYEQGTSDRLSKVVPFVRRRP